MVIFGAAWLIAVMIWFEVNAKGMFQLLAVAAIVDAAVTILVPIFHRLSTAQVAPASGDAPALDIEAIDREIEHIRVRLWERSPYTTKR